MLFKVNLVSESLHHYILGAKHYTRAVDVWAMGCILGELITLAPLFKGVEVRGTNDMFDQSQLEHIFKVGRRRCKLTLA